MTFVFLKMSLVELYNLSETWIHTLNFFLGKE